MMILSVVCIPNTIIPVASFIGIDIILVAVYRKPTNIFEDFSGY